MNQLSIIVKDSGLETNEGQTLLEKFGNYEQIAKEWEVKAKEIVVTSRDQTTEMEMAKVARLEKEKTDKLLAEERVKVQKEALEKAGVQKLLDEQIECPFCHQKFNK